MKPLKANIRVIDLEKLEGGLSKPIPSNWIAVKNCVRIDYSLSVDDWQIPFEFQIENGVWVPVYPNIFSEPQRLLSSNYPFDTSIRFRGEMEAGKIKLIIYETHCDVE